MSDLCRLPVQLLQRVIALDSISRRKLVYSGVLLALLMALLFIRTAMPFVQLSLSVLSSFLLGVVLMETDLKYAILFYVSSVLLSLLLPVDKMSLILFHTLFGAYGVVKHLIERIPSRWGSFPVKILYFLAVYWLNMQFAQAFLPFIGETELAWYFSIPLATLAFLFYDFLYTLFAVFYWKKIHPLIWRGRR